MLTTIVSFLIALGVLIAVHEYGHYRVAVACGVRVLRFSVGFGKVIWRWQPRRQHPGQDTEFVIGAFPLGGYVRMLDEREGPVDPAERHRAFNTQPLRSRAAIVAAGPLANLLLAVLLYAVVAWTGTQEPRPIVASPLAGSVAEAAGLRGGETVLRAGRADADVLTPVGSFEDLRWHLTRGALNGEDVRLLVGQGDGDAGRELVLRLSGLDVREADATLLRKIGIMGPHTPAVIGDVMADGPAAKAGLRKGDRVLRVGDQVVVDGAQLRELIRRSVRDGQPLEQVWTIERDGARQGVAVRPEVRVDPAAGPVGRIAAYVGGAPQMTTVRFGPFDGLWRGLERTWEVSVLTLKMMGRMLIGEASLKNLSGPLTIADYAGKSASIGLAAFLTFLALISVSLGVLNLLPLPVLDGGHLMYYLWEAVTGREISDAWMERLQRGGVAVLLVMMSIALFNDVTRIFG